MTAVAVVTLIAALSLLACGTEPPTNRGGGGDHGAQSCELSLHPIGSFSRTLETREEINLRVWLGDDCDGARADVAIVFTFIGANLGATLLATQALTDESGVAATRVTAGDAAGEILIAARHPDATEDVQFTLTVTTDPCAGHCNNGIDDCGESGTDCGGGCGVCGTLDDAAVDSGGIPAQILCDSSSWLTATMHNTGTTTWFTNGTQGYKLGYVGDYANPFLPAGNSPRVDLPAGQSVAPNASFTFSVPIVAPTVPGSYGAEFQMLRESVHWFGAVASGNVTVNPGCGPQTGCAFPQGVPDGDFAYGAGNDPALAETINDVMVALTGCSAGSNCIVGPTYPTAQIWFDAVNDELRALGNCAGQHIGRHTDEIAVSTTGCTGHWYGYHIYNYGGDRVVWNPGAQRDYWTIDSQWCPCSVDDSLAGRGPAGCRLHSRQAPVGSCCPTGTPCEISNG